MQVQGKSRLISHYFNIVTVKGAKTINFGDRNYGIEAGKPANLIVLDAEDCYDAIRRRAAVRYVISRGKLLAETVPGKTTFSALRVWLNMSQGAIPDESPRNLQEQLLLQDALAGNGKGIQGGANNMLGDAPRLVAIYGGSPEHWYNDKHSGFYH